MHNVTFSQLWVQYVDTRLLVAFALLVGFGVVDHLNEQSIMLFSAGLFIAAFVLLLPLFRSYLGRRLTFLPVLTLGIVWFSVADFQNSLWSFQVAWYFVVLCFVAIAFVLLIPHHHRDLCLAVAIVAAVAASLTEVQGFVVWPTALICLVWASPWRRRTYVESAIWIASAVVTTALYLHGFVFAADTNICVVEGGQKASCSLTFGLLHPGHLARFFTVLVGNVVPTLPGTYVLGHEILGSAICIVAGFIVVQMTRQRRLHPNPLPLLLIVFGLLFDLVLALSRLGEGLNGAGIDRYTMPNIILLAGIVVYGWGRAPSLSRTSDVKSWPEWIKVLGAATLAVFLVVQVVVATQFGVTNGNAMRATSEEVARVVVNLDRIPNA